MSTQNYGDFQGAKARLIQLKHKGFRTIEAILSALNSEFHMCFYVSNGAMWTQYTDEQGRLQCDKMGAA